MKRAGEKDIRTRERESKGEGICVEEGGVLECAGNAAGACMLKRRESVCAREGTHRQGRGARNGEMPSAREGGERVHMGKGDRGAHEGEGAHARERRGRK